ncbi:hypothetical protein [Runella sp.]|uniref:hypothetical protein n=1 Tax=Runella sp. TaxID=1960881 RepID=UPI003D104089
MSTANYQLFFVKNLSDFPDGTLFELENRLYSHAQISKAANEKRQEIADWEYHTKGYLLPDRGDGVQAILPEEKVIICAPFSQNFSPLKGQLQITKTATKSRQYPDAPAPSNVPVGILERNHVSVFQNIHFQQVIIELPSERFEIEQIAVFNKVKQFEAECYYSPKLKKEDGQWKVVCEFSHITFGFYEVQVQFTEGRYYSIDLIKHYPEEVKEKFDYLNQSTRPTQQPASFTPLKEIGFDLSEFQFPAVQTPIPTTTDMGVNDEVLNDAIEFTTEWGANFGKPIYERLNRKYPHIDAEWADKIQKYCRQAESYIYQLGEKELNGEITEYDIIPMAQQKYPWVKVRHWARLKNIAMFYARK